MANDKTEVRRILDAVKAEGRTSLTAPEGKLVCDAYGIATPKEGVATVGRRSGEARRGDGLPGRAQDRLAGDPAQDGSGRRARRREERRGRARRASRRSWRTRRSTTRKATLLGVQVQQMLARRAGSHRRRRHRSRVRQARRVRAGRHPGRGAEGHHVPPRAGVARRRAVDAGRHRGGRDPEGRARRRPRRPRGARGDDRQRLAARRRLPRDRRDGPEPGVRDEERARSPPTCASSSTSRRSPRATARARRRSSAR